MKIREIVENLNPPRTLSGYIMNLGFDRLPTRLRHFIQSEFSSFDAFIDAVIKFERVSPKAEEILINDKLTSLINHLDVSDSDEIQRVNRSQVDQPDTMIDEFNSERMNTIITDLGREPEWLFRFVSKGELDYIEQSGFMSPSKFYNRVHASVQPDFTYQEPGGELIAIKFDSRHQWKVKRASIDVYATTYENIPTSYMVVVK
jgi:hypothetical protein